jgi:cold shock CspA family protein
MILTLYKTTKWTLILLIIFYATSLWGSIGNVDQIEGNGVIDRKDGDKDIFIKQELEIEQFDTVKTGNGKVGILFIDDTRVDVTQHSKLIIDEFVYDPNTKKGKLNLSAKLGTIRYASGQIAKTSKQDIVITTPTATIGVRGTDFTMTIDELGGSTIILLPSCDVAGNCLVGEISVESAAGQVILNQAFQATQINVPESPPSQPVKLDLEIEMINNMLIVAKPEALEEENYENKLKEVADALDLDFLQFDDLEIDYLEEEEDLYVTGLDIDFLQQNFLADILAQINEELARQMRNEFDKQQSTDGIFLGKNPETGVIILDEDPQWVWIREDASGAYIELRLDKEYGYILNIIQGEFEMYDFELLGQDNEINILQVQ